MSSSLVLSQAIHCLECSEIFKATDELFKHQSHSGHTDFELRSVYTFRMENALKQQAFILPRIGLS